MVFFTKTHGQSNTCSDKVFSLCLSPSDRGIKIKLIAYILQSYLCLNSASENKGVAKMICVGETIVGARIIGMAAIDTGTYIC